MSIHVSTLYYYPIKSCRGISLSQATIAERGIVNDRHLMLVDQDGQFLTQREHHRLSLVHVDLQGSTMTLEAPAMSPLSIAYIEEGARTQVVIWGATCEAVDQGDEVANWFSRYLGISCRLVRIANDFVRPVNPRYAHSEQDNVAFPDGYPLLLLSQASLDDLNQRLAEPVDIRRFRPNIVVTGCEAFAEDNWRHIRIGSVEFYVVKPCVRCVITTIDPDQAVAGVEPLKTLATFRRAEKGVIFGMNTIHASTGCIQVGDQVEILA